MGLPGAQVERSVEWHGCVCRGLWTWHLMPAVPVLMAQAAASGEFGLTAITSHHWRRYSWVYLGQSLSTAGPSPRHYRDFYAWLCSLLIHH